MLREAARRGGVMEVLLVVFAGRDASEYVLARLCVFCERVIVACLFFFGGGGRDDDAGGP